MFSIYIYILCLMVRRSIHAIYSVETQNNAHPCFLFLFHEEVAVTVRSGIPNNALLSLCNRHTRGIYSVFIGTRIMWKSTRTRRFSCLRRSRGKIHDKNKNIFLVLQSIARDSVWYVVSQVLSNEAVQQPFVVPAACTSACTIIAFFVVRRYSKNAPLFLVEGNNILYGVV